MDSDDWIDSDVCEVLYALARQNKADIAVESYEIAYPDRKECVYTFKGVEDALGKLNKEKREILIMQRGYFWSKMFRREFLQLIFEDGILFSEGVYYEDSAFNTLTTLGAQSICRTDHICYHYWQNPASIVHKIENQLDKLHISTILIQKAHEPKWEEYRDILYYKAAVLVGSALLYGWIPLYKQRNTMKLKESFVDAKNQVNLLRKGGYWSRLDSGMRQSLEEVADHPKIFKVKQKLLGLLGR